MKVLERLVLAHLRLQVKSSLDPLIRVWTTPSSTRYSVLTHHLQKFLDNSAVVGCIKDGREEEYRAVVDDFGKWFGKKSPVA